MGNTLQHPVTDKETEAGSTEDEDHLQFGASSMQGWRIHMEDAHVCETNLYAEEYEDYEEVTPETMTRKLKHAWGKAKKHSHLSNDSGHGGSDAAAACLVDQWDHRECTEIPLPNHSLFAVFDGHGGTFSADYCSKNFWRVLRRQPKFVLYAKFVRDHSDQSTATDNNGGDAHAAAAVGPPLPRPPNHEEEEEGVHLLECAMRSAFVDLDRELLMEMMRRREKKKEPGSNHSSQSEKNAPSSKNPQGDAAPNPNHNGEPRRGEEDRGELIQDAPPADADHAHPNSDGLDDSGTTAVAVIIAPGFVVCANAGDSRAVCGRSGHKAVPLSFDHKPDDEAEEARIRRAGGYVSAGRVDGELAVARSLGDFVFKEKDAVLSAGWADDGGHHGAHHGHYHFGGWLKNHHKNKKKQDSEVVVKAKAQKVSAVPDTVVLERDAAEDEFIILACDGVWDVMTNQKCADAVAEIFCEGEANMNLVCEEMLDICLKRGSQDNMTVVIVKMPAQIVGEGGGVPKRRKVREAAVAERDARVSERMSNAPD